MICFLCIFFVLACSSLFSCLLVTSLCCVVSCFILCLVPPGVYTVYYFKNWVISFVMYVVHMDSFFTEFIYVIFFQYVSVLSLSLAYL
jgi:hypothetical protein